MLPVAHQDSAGAEASDELGMAGDLNLSGRDLVEAGVALVGERDAGLVRGAVPETDIAIRFPSTAVPNRLPS